MLESGNPVERICNTPAELASRCDAAGFLLVQVGDRWQLQTKSGVELMPPSSLLLAGAKLASLEAQFDEPQRTPTPGQFIVLYEGDRCLGGATIDAATTSIAIRAAG